MDLSPPALTRSPSTPSNTYCPSESITRLSLARTRRAAIQTRRYTLSPPARYLIMDHENSLPPLDAMGHPEWSTTGVMHPVSSATSMPSILAAGIRCAYGSYEPGRLLRTTTMSTASHTSHPHHAATPSAGRAVSCAIRTVCARLPVEHSSAPGSLTLGSRWRPLLPSTASSSRYHTIPSPRSIHAPYPADNNSYTTPARATSRTEAHRDGTSLTTSHGAPTSIPCVGTPPLELRARYETTVSCDTAKACAAPAHH